jgi:acetyltransferase
MRLIGPNCLGVMIPSAGLNATFAKKMAAPGNVAFISQSGALGTAILDWSLRERVGFSAFLSTGSMLDVGWGDLIDYLADDPSTRSILSYMESIGDARSFLSAAREVALRKPIIIIKAGTTEAAAKAVASHTGTLTGNDAVLNAAFRRAGVLRVNTIADLFDMAEVLSKQPRPKGPRLAVITNAGGPGVLATDMLVTEGGEIAQLSEESSRKLNEFLPSHWSRGNPVDLLGDATADRFIKAVEIVSADSGNDGILVILTPQAMTDATAIAKGVSAFNKIPGKPILASWMGASEVTEGEAILNASAILTFEYPDTAARSFCYMWRYSDNLRALYETPALTAGFTDNARGRASAAAIIKAAQRVGRTLLTEVESKQILDAYGIPTVPARIARSEDEAVLIPNLGRSSFSVQEGSWSRS